MDKLILENIRCFRAKREVPLRPVTVLVGENSTGKTTFLAAARVAADLLRSEVRPDFNKEPFNLGTFNEIASYFGGRAGRAKEFTVGCEMEAAAGPARRRRARTRVRLLAAFASEGGQPALSRFDILCGDIAVTARRTSGEGAFTVRLHGKVDGAPFERGLRVPERFLRYGETPSIGSLVNAALFGGEIPAAVAQRLEHTLYGAFAAHPGTRPFAFAPIRTRPERTYDPKTDLPRPEGNHVPMVLARARSDNPELWQRIERALAGFASSCGLFTSLGIKKLGRTSSDPFRVTVKVAGPSRNLIDVGYGVSQLLPILVDIVMGGRGQLFLLQQPEVHLHPRAQAELGSFLGRMAARDGKRFLVETHSDHLVDRIRLDVRDRTTGIAERDVMILYFERGEHEVTVHPITLDKRGELVDAPASYREFFLREQARLFGV